MHPAPPGLLRSLLEPLTLHLPLLVEEKESSKKDLLILVSSRMVALGYMLYIYILFSKSPNEW